MRRAPVGLAVVLALLAADAARGQEILEVEVHDLSAIEIRVNAGGLPGSDAALCLVRDRGGHVRMGTPACSSALRPPTAPRSYPCPCSRSPDGPGAYREPRARGPRARANTLAPPPPDAATGGSFARCNISGAPFRLGK
jgi:hypothetical protein